MKKAILLLLTLALTLGSLPLSAVALTATPLEIPAEVETWERDGVTYTVLRAPEDFSKIVDGGNYILAADVDFGGKETDYLISLSGTVLLEGNCHSITGYTLKGEGDVATFNVKTGAGLTIRNLTLGSASAPISVSTTGEIAGHGVWLCQLHLHGGESDGLHQCVGNRLLRGRNVR